MNHSLDTGLVVSLSGVLALAFSLYLTPFIRRAAERYDIVDRPDGHLKHQREPVPYLGGLVVFLALIAAVAVVHPLESKVLAIFLAASLVVCFGLVDDLGTLVPRDKLLGQLIAALVLVRAGVQIQIDAVPEPLDTLISVFWLVTVTNAFNIIDVHDGLCAGIGAVATAFFGVFALLQGEVLVAVLCAALFGSLLGFLWFNFPPARIYLGDTGSMLIGLVLGALAMVSDYSAINPLAALFSPLAVLYVPLFDLGFVVLARLRHRIPFYHGSPDHFAVRLRRAGVPARRITLGAIFAGVVMGTLAVLAAQVTATTALLILGLVVAGTLGVFIWLWQLDPRRPSSFEGSENTLDMVQPPARERPSSPPGT
ncbi:MAG: MraY family glycosyltransferase [Pseudomonadota bacterium]